MEDLVIEILKDLQQRMTVMDDRLSRIENRLSSVDGHIGALVQSHAANSLDFDRLQARVARIEARLNIAE